MWLYLDGVAEFCRRQIDYACVAKKTNIFRSFRACHTFSRWHQVQEDFSDFACARAINCEASSGRWAPTVQAACACHVTFVLYGERLCCQGTFITCIYNLGTFLFWGLALQGSHLLKFMLLRREKGENGRGAHYLGLLGWTYRTHWNCRSTIELDLFDPFCTNQFQFQHFVEQLPPPLTGHVRSTGGSCCRRNAAFNSCGLSTSFSPMERFDQGNRITWSFPSPQFRRQAHRYSLRLIIR